MTKASLMLRLGIAACAFALSSPLAARADATSDSFGSLAYRSIGPAISGGRATAIAGSDRDPAVYYAGGAGGGVFKSTDGGVSWRPTFDRERVAPIGALAVSARDPNDVWAGSGEANPRNTVEEGAGMWHSVNGGKTWRHAGLDDAGSIASISLDPRAPRTVVAGVLGHVFRDGTMRGVFVTHDAGAHWTRTLYLGPSSGVSDLARVPDHPATLFAGMWQFRRQPWTMSSGGPQGGLFRSDDGGATWRKLTGHGLPDGITGRIGVAAATRGRIYAIIQSKYGEIWRSDDGGGVWRAMPHDPLIGARPFYFSRLSVDPANRDRVVNVSLILSLSTNGARSFRPIATNAGWDYHSVWFSGDGRRIAVAHDEGVVLSADGGRHWSQPYGLPISQPYHVGFDSVMPSYAVCTGLQDLAEEGPVRWTGTYEQNRGPKEGAEAIPGTYTARVVVDGVPASQPVVVKRDPRDPAPADDYVKRHAFLAELNREIGVVDAQLNALDARIKRAAPAQRPALEAMEHRLTLDPRNIEDLKTPPRLRERLLDLLSRVSSSSFQAPTAAQEAEAAALRALYAERAT